MLLLPIWGAQILSNQKTKDVANRLQPSPKLDLFVYTTAWQFHTELTSPAHFTQKIIYFTALIIKGYFRFSNG